MKPLSASWIRPNTIGRTKWKPASLINDRGIRREPSGCRLPSHLAARRPLSTGHALRSLGAAVLPWYSEEMRSHILFGPTDVATAEPPGVRSRLREEIPDRFKWKLTDIFPDWETWESAYKTARSGHRGLHRAQGHARRRARQAARRVPPVRVDGPARLPRLVFPGAAVRRGPARQRHQREAAAGPDPVRAARPGRVLVQPRAAVDSARDRPRLDGTLGAPARVPVRHREPVSAAGARARRVRRAVDVAGEPPGLGAKRRLLGAVDGGCEVSNHHDVDRRAGHGLVRAVPRPSGHAPRSGRPRSRVSRAARNLSIDPQHLRHALQRRLPA